MTESKMNGSKPWLVVVLTMLQTVFIGISGWMLTNIIDQGRTIASLRPTIDAMQASASLAIHKDTYDRDLTHNEEAHRKVEAEVQNVQARIMEMRLKTAELELKLLQQAAERNK